MDNPKHNSRWKFFCKHPETMCTGNPNTGSLPPTACVCTQLCESWWLSFHPILTLFEAHGKPPSGINSQYIQTLFSPGISGKSKKPQELGKVSTNVVSTRQGIILEAGDNISSYTGLISFEVNKYSRN